MLRRREGRTRRRRESRKNHRAGIETPLPWGQGRPVCEPLAYQQRLRFCALSIKALVRKGIREEVDAYLQHYDSHMAFISETHSTGQSVEHHASKYCWFCGGRSETDN